MRQVQSTLVSPELNTIAMTDPEVIKVYRDQVANQINAHRMSQAPPREVLDLSAFIADIVIETTVQGSGILEVHVIDPGWILLRRDADGVSFLDVDEAGYLWPPIDLNFPADVSDAMWRLCGLRPSTDLTGANIVLVFEDMITAVLRENLGPVASRPNETRAEFIFRLVRSARLGAQLPAVANMGRPHPGPPDGRIRFVSLLPHDAFTVADLTAAETVAPRSAVSPNAPPARKNHKKKPLPFTGFPPILAPVSKQSLLIQEGLDLTSAPPPPSGPVYIPPYPGTADAPLVPGIPNPRLGT